MTEQTAAASAGHEKRRGYETSDLSPRHILLFLFFGVVMLSAAAFFLMWGLLRVLDIGEEVLPSPQIEGARLVPAPPRLQVKPARDLGLLHQAEDDLLKTYEWVDRGKGVVRIPIERAMELLSEGGRLPVRSGQR